MGPVFVMSYPETRITRAWLDKVNKANLVFQVCLDRSHHHYINVYLYIVTVFIDPSALKYIDLYQLKD